MNTRNIKNLGRYGGMLSLFFAVSITYTFAQTPPKKHEDGVEILKGTMFSSLNFSYSRRDAENNDQLLVYYQNQKRYRSEVRLDPGYVVKNNLGVGIGLLYGNDQGNSVQLSSDGVITTNRFYGDSYAVRPFVKSFLPLGSGKRFYIIIPAELQFGYGGRVNESTTNEILTRTYTETLYYGFELRPGLLAFIVDNFGFEVSVGAFGLSSSIANTSTTGQPDGKVETNDINLAINLFQLSLGFSLYIN